MARFSVPCESRKTKRAAAGFFVCCAHGVLHFGFLALLFFLTSRFFLGYKKEPLLVNAKLRTEAPRLWGGFIGTRTRSAVGCDHVQVATLSQNGAGKQEVLHVGPHACGDAACKIPSQGGFDRSLQNIESAMDGTLTIRGKSMFWVRHKQTKTKWDLVRTGQTEKN